ncbi:esterase/lipase family protein [Pseudomonadota bacterium]
MVHEYEKQDGLTCLTKNQEKTQAHLVFVHGMQGGAFSTWDSGSESELGFWPAVVAKNNPWCCVWTLHYKADILEYPWESNKTLDLLHKSNWLMSELVLNRIHEKPLVFVCHSLGGVLVKQVLQFSQFYGDDNWRLLWRHTQAVIFLATPHVGAGMANIVLAISKAIRINFPWPARSLLSPSKALKNLEKNNPTLIYLRNWYRNYAPAQGIKTMAFAEGKAVGPFIVVNIEDANPQVAFSPLVPLSDEDHISIAKPRNLSNTVYKQVGHYLEDLKKQLDEGRILKILPSDRNEATFMREKEVMKKLAQERNWISSLTGFWWEYITVGGEKELSFFQIRPNSQSYMPSLWGEHYDKNGLHISNWNSVIAGVEKVKDQIIVNYHWEGRHIKGKNSGLKFSGFGRMKFQLSNESIDRIDKGTGEFWDVNESHLEQTAYKSIELRRAVDSDTIFKMENGSEKEVKSLVIERIP